jgi:hypothetical protein
MMYCVHGVTEIGTRRAGKALILRGTSSAKLSDHPLKHQEQQS